MFSTVVYRHRRNDTGEIFYIGEGNIKRPNRKKGRNQFWYNIVNKCGYTIEIVAKGLSKEDAWELEIFLISEYGRRDLGTGPLVNLTPGGGFTSEKLKGNKHAKGYKHSKETRILISEANKGRVLSPNHINKLKTTNSRVILDTATGIYYQSGKEASELLEINYNTLMGWLSGKYKNNTNMKIC